MNTLLEEKITLDVLGIKIKGAICEIKTFPNDPEVVQIGIMFPSWETKIEEWDNKSRRFPATAKISLLVPTNSKLFKKLYGKMGDTKK